MKQKNSAVVALYILSCCLWGGYHEFVSGLLATALTCWLLFHRSDALRFSRSIGFLTPCVVALCYLLVTLWAQDRGMAPIGFVKFLPLPLFALCLLQDESLQERCLRSIPWIGCIMTVLSGLGSLLPVIGERFTVMDRLAGFFEYPNTFALFLLLGLLLLAAGEGKGLVPLGQMAVLLGGIFLSGSRTVFVLTVLSLLYLCIRNDNLWMRRVCRILLPTGVAAALVVVWLTGSRDSIGRFLTTSLESSTLLGRLLYAQDALKLALRYPFGMGYGSYRFLQGSVQTGVYAVQFVHNDLLQCVLDIGWLPAGLVVLAIIRALRHATPRNRLLLVVLCAHGLFDFSFQFVCIPMTMLLLVDYGKVKSVKYNSLAAVTGMATILCSIYFTAAGFMAYLGQTQMASTLYPGYTYAMVQELDKENAATEISDRIIRLNAHVAPAYYEMALAGYQAGDFNSVIKNMRLAIENAPYEIGYYELYAQMLNVGLQRYEQGGDMDSAALCRQELRHIPVVLDYIREHTSALGWKIADQPQLTLSAETQEIIDRIVKE